MRDYAGLLPVFLELDLYNAGWNGDINPYPDITPRQYAMQSLRRSLVKKFSDGASDAADSKALSLFRKINDDCRGFCLDTSGLSEVEYQAIGEAKKFIYEFFYKAEESGGLWSETQILTFNSISKGFGVGNGANIGASSTDFLSKLGLSTLAATDSSLQHLYTAAIRSDPIWSDVESIRQNVRGYQIVRGSRLSFVPKTCEISRTICTEPVLNMMFQKGIAEVLERRLEETCGIGLDRQPDKNRILALLGSKNGRFGTIDLSSASDSMSNSLVDEFFPPQVVYWLKKTRSPVTILPDGTELELHMVSSMGNAFTFPLQTLFFTSLVYASYRMLDIKIEYPFRKNLGNLAVFGDDIIVESKAYDLVCRLLNVCGFKVNVDKSFNTGLFRESCGHDYFHGHNVRGVYIKTLKDVCDKYSAINRLNYWSALHGIPLCHTVSFLMKGTRFLPIPFDEMDTAGIKVHSTHLRRTWRDRYTGALRYRYLHIESIETSVQDVVERPPKIKGWFNNHSAVLLSALAGTVRSGKVVTRSHFRRSTRCRVRNSPNWDYVGPRTSFDPCWGLKRTAQGVNPEFGKSWKWFVELNLNLS
jgi:hypothetical protein